MKQSVQLCSTSAKQAFLKDLVLTATLDPFDYYTHVGMPDKKMHVIKSKRKGISNVPMLCVECIEQQFWTTISKCANVAKLNILAFQACDFLHTSNADA